MKWRGGISGFMSAFIALVIFALIEETQLAVQYMFTFDIQNVVLIILVGSILSSFPAAAGGIFLAYLLYQNVNNVRISTSAMVIIGSLLGAIVGLGISVLVCFLIKGIGYLYLYLRPTVEVVILALIAGGCTSKHLAAYSIEN